MKKKLIGVILFIVFLMGCSGLSIKREVVNNTLISRFPKMTITLPAEFELISRADDKFISTGSMKDNLVRTDMSVDSYYFISSRRNSIDIQKAVLISFTKLKDLNWYIKSDLFNGDYYTQKIGGDVYQYIIYYGEPLAELVKPAKEKGRSFSSGMFLSAANKVNERHVIRITYYEKISDAEYGALIKDDDKKEKRIAAYLKAFNQRFLKTVQLKNG